MTFLGEQGQDALGPDQAPVSETEHQPQVVVILFTELAAGAGVSTQAKILGQRLNAPVISAGDIKKLATAADGVMQDVHDTAGLITQLKQDTPQKTQQIETIASKAIQQLIDSGHRIIIYDTKNPLAFPLDGNIIKINFLLEAAEEERAIRTYLRKHKSKVREDISPDDLATEIEENAERASLQLINFANAYEQLGLPTNLDNLKSRYIQEGFRPISTDKPIAEVAGDVNSILQQEAAQNPVVAAAIAHQQSLAA